MLVGGTHAPTVMTGGTSGFGAIAAERISGADGIRLVHSARHAASTGEALPLDLSSLDSVRTFAATVRERSDRIDGLVLNAGMIRSDVAARTVDGFETTFVVNHLAHYLLLRQLLPALADRAVVVATSSGTRDPATGAGLVPPRHGDAGLLAHPERDPDLDTHPRKAGQHAYTASKLCTVLTMRRLSKNDTVRAGRITAVAFDPGQVFGTGLARALPTPMRLAWRGLGTRAGMFLRIVQDTFNTQTEAGNTLADLVLGDIDVPDGRGYLALRRGEPSVLARSDEQAERSWRESARLVGLPDR